MAILSKEHGLLYIQVPATGCSVAGRLIRDRLNGIDVGRKHSDVPELLAGGLISEDELSELCVVANVRNPYDRIVSYYQRLNGPWIEKYFEYPRRKAKRLLEAGELSNEQYEGRLRELAIAEKKQRRRASVIRLIGFNLWVQLTLLRWRFLAYRSQHGTASGLMEYMFPMLSRVDVVLRQEDLESGLNQLFSRLGLAENVSLPRKNITDGKKHYTYYYNALSRWVLDRLFGSQLMQFGYEFDNARNSTALIVLRPNKGE